jgi:hypothetical protein
MAKRSAHDELRQKAQSSLRDFLHGELALASTLIQSSQLATDQGHWDHAARAKQKAETAVRSIRRFLEHVSDGNARRQIEEQLPPLDRLIASL